MAERKKLIIELDPFTYREIIQISPGSYVRNTPPLEGGYNVGFNSRSFIEWVNIFSETTKLNDKVLAQRMGTLECLYTGSMLYPISRIADIGTINFERMVTIYVHEGLVIHPHL